MYARYEISITPAQTGHRVSLRRRVGGGKFSDVVGVLEAWEHGVLTVRRRNGERVTVAEDTLVAGKIVPPLPGEPMRSGRHSTGPGE
jgi:hypothetical protein